WALGTPGIMLYMATTSFFEGISRPYAAMLVSLGGNLINLALAWALTFGAAGLPAMGGAGAVLATSITLWLMFLALAGCALLLPGLPVALSVGFETIAFSGATIMAGWLGKTPLAAYQLSNNVISFFYMLSLGLATAAAVRVGNAIGRGDQKDISRSGWAAVYL